MSTTITTEASAHIDYLGGAMTGTVKIEGISVRVRRRFWFDRDIDGTWSVFVDTAETEEVTLDTPTGAVYATDPAVCAFIEQLAALFANPDAFAKS